MTGPVRLPILADRPGRGAFAARMTRVAARPPGTLLVHEIYASIQGESTYAGLPCTFVRLTGCPLRCRWCDTPHAFTEGGPLTISEIVRRAEELGPRLVEVTGGEPLAQPECDALLTALADRGLAVLLETSGAISIATVDPRVVVVLDLKCPSSGEVESNDYENLDRLKPTDEVKFVVGTREDFEWAVSTITARGLLRRPVLMSPVFGELAYAELASWILETGLSIRCQVPLQKVIWPPDARGV